MVFISIISAPQASNCLVISASSSSEISGFSKRAEPPPDSKNKTVSSLFRLLTISIAACVPRKEFSSGTGCPASKQIVLGIAPFTWSYLVTTTPACKESPKTLLAA